MGCTRSCLIALLLTGLAAPAARGDLPIGLPGTWSLPSVDGLPVAPELPTLPAAPARVRFGLPGPDRLAAGAAGAELHGLEGSDPLLGAAGGRPGFRAT